MKLYYCDVTGSKTQCIFTERTMQPLWKRTGGDIPRCIRHGQLICNEADAESKEALRERWAENERKEFGGWTCGQPKMS